MTYGTLTLQCTCTFTKTTKIAYSKYQTNLQSQGEHNTPFFRTDPKFCLFILIIIQHVNNDYRVCVISDIDFIAAQKYHVTKV